MRKRNRKKTTLRSELAPLRFVSAVVVAAMIALAYVWLNHCEQAIGCEYAVREGERDDLAKRLLNEQYKWTRAKSPRNISKALDQHGIRMTWPVQSQIVHLRDLGVWEGEEPARSTRFERMVRND